MIKEKIILFFLFISIVSCNKEIVSLCDQYANMITIDDSLKVKRKVLVVGIDGFRSDAMQQAITPFMYELSQKNSAYYTSYHVVEEYTWSGPNWSSILNGVHSEKHNVTRNVFINNNYQTYPSFFSYIEEADSNINTVSIVNWTPINNFILSSHVDYAPLESMNDSLVFENAKNMLVNSNPVSPDVMFLHFDELDAAGHSYGFSPFISEYRNTLNKLDLYVETLFNIIQSKRNKGEDWIFFIVSDHGGQGTGHSDTKNPHVNTTVFFTQHPYLTFKSNYISNQADLAPTILDFMGISNLEFDCKTDGVSILK